MMFKKEELDTKEELEVQTQKLHEDIYDKEA